MLHYTRTAGKTEGPNRARPGISEGERWDRSLPVPPTGRGRLRSPGPFLASRLYRNLQLLRETIGQHARVAKSFAFMYNEYAPARGDCRGAGERRTPHFGQYKEKTYTAGEPADASAARADGFSAHGAPFRRRPQEVCRGARAGDARRPEDLPRRPARGGRRRSRRGRYLSCGHHCPDQAGLEAPWRQHPRARRGPQPRHSARGHAGGAVLRGRARRAAACRRARLHRDGRAAAHGAHLL